MDLPEVPPKSSKSKIHSEPHVPVHLEPKSSSHPVNVDAVKFAALKLQPPSPPISTIKHSFSRAEEQHPEVESSAEENDSFRSNKTASHKSNLMIEEAALGGHYRGLKQLELSLERALVQIKHLKARVRDMEPLQDENVSLEQANESLRLEILQLKNDNENVRAQYKESLKECKRLRKECEEYQAEVNELDDEILALQNEKEQLEKEQLSARVTQSETYEWVNKANQKHDEESDRIKDLEKALAIESATRQDIEGQFRQLKSQHQNLVKRFEERECDVDKLQEALQLLHFQKSEAEEVRDEEVKHQHQKIHRLRKEKNELMENIKSLAQDKIDTECQYVELREEHAQSIKSMEVLLIEKTERISFLEKELKHAKEIQRRAGVDSVTPRSQTPQEILLQKKEQTIKKLQRELNCLSKKKEGPRELTPSQPHPLFYYDLSSPELDTSQQNAMECDDNIEEGNALASPTFRGEEDLDDKKKSLKHSMWRKARVSKPNSIFPHTSKTFTM